MKHEATEEGAWREFWEIIGAEAYRLWREEQTAATDQEAA